MTNMSIPSHVVNLSAGGCLHSTEELHTPAVELPEIFAGLAASGLTSMTIYFHGGVMNERIGLRLAKHYYRIISDRCVSYPVSVVWETGVLETIQSHLVDICTGSPLFLCLVRKLFDEVSRRLGWLDVLIEEEPPGKELEIGASLADLASEALLMTDPSVLARAVLRPGRAIPELTDADVLQFVQELADDEQANAQLAQVIVNARTGQSRLMTEAMNDPGWAVGYLSPAIVDELLAETLVDMTAGAEDRGLVGTAYRWLFAGNVLRAVMRRFQEGTDHGLLATICEEVYRWLYADKIGMFLWSKMKKNASDAYRKNSGNKLVDDLHGGTLFIELLNKYMHKHGHLDINLIGYSAGSIHICHFLQKAAEVLDAGFAFKNVIFLAPACNFETFCAGLVAHAERVENFRIFTMADFYERQDPLVKSMPIAYPHSLLYLVSGLFEGERPDVPLVGLARHLQGERYEADPDVQASRAFLRRFEVPVVYSVTSSDAVPGQQARFTSHYGQPKGPNHDTATLDSIVAMIGPVS